MKNRAIQICKRLQDNGHDGFIVGGATRDSLLGLPVKDYDVATNALPDELIRLFPQAKLVGVSFGVVVVGDVEITSYRRDGRYVDCRRPESIEFGNIEDDARRRDFTVNSLYQNPLTGEIVDLVGGMADIKHKILRCVGDARQRFAEDALRMLRAIRFCSSKGLSMHQDTLFAIVNARQNITLISAERIRDELTGILVSQDPVKGLNLLIDTGLMQLVLPEIMPMLDTPQSPEYHPEGITFVHAALTTHHVDPKTPANCWAALLHDVGKPATFRNEDGKMSFLGHASVGAEIAEGILMRLRFSNDDVKKVCSMTRDHMKFMDLRVMRRSRARLFMGSEYFLDTLALHKADALSSNCDLSDYTNAVKMYQEYEGERDKILPKPLVGGEDLMSIGIRPGPRMGQILNEIREMQLDLKITDKQQALEHALSMRGE